MARTPLEGPFVWTSDELDRSSDWQFPLTPPMLGELDRAVSALRRRGVTWEAMRPRDFPLDETGRLLARVSEWLERGRGVAKITGVPVDDYDEADRRRLWFGIGLHLVAPHRAAEAGDVHNPRHRAELALQHPVLHRLDVIERVDVPAGTILGDFQDIAKDLTGGGLRRDGRGYVGRQRLADRRPGWLQLPRRRPARARR